ncbi:J domain-containing protein [Nostoc parmelioides]|uniref:J domain-containing protein n=1 Tax=Nostoc parmelioides FACHB-3921 TaxID=2692909 RepID=A0ABR8BCB7_9NOSO|nr:J domain-containing protein [Nostoc parmelioides]MBD2251717.1 J domain-containing protein [Nostoc parmelioides FACHB-3921]
MPRKTSSTSHSLHTTPLALSQLHIRLAGLEKEHKALLKKIKSKRTELKNFIEQMRSLATETFHRASPGFTKISELDKEIHTLFAEIFTTRKFGKQTEKKIKAVYLNLQMAGIISPKFESNQPELELDETSDESQQENNFFQGNNSHQHQRGQTQPELGFSSVNRTDESRKIRQTFLRLAEIFHPDKVKDSETQINHTEIMKEINKAYQEGDLARLLEIEQKHQVGELIDHNSEDDLTRKCKTLAQQNEILITQYENLKKELRLVKNTPEGAMVADSRKAAKQGIDPIAQMLESMEIQINLVTEIRDFVKNFKAQKITIKEFLNGPESLYSLQQEMMEDMLEQMLSELDGMIIF